MILFRTFRFMTVFAIVLCLFLGQPPALLSQASQDLQDLKRRVAVLTDQQRFTEALPLLEELVAREPSNPDGYYFLGFAWLASAKTVTDDEKRKALVKRGREAFIRARELGSTREILNALIDSIPSDGSLNETYSKNLEAQASMVQAERLFGEGKLQDAFRYYQSALTADPKLYEAALFSGDVFTQQGDFAQAEIWYQKAIEIDPNREVAYRYSATPFMKLGRTKDALARYAEAYLTEPYSKFSQAGLVQWANLAGVRVGHPEIDFPVAVTPDRDLKVRIEVDVRALSNTDDGSSAWLVYGGARAEWAKTKFAETFPLEKSYRHTLAEETDALRAVIAAASALKVKRLNPSLAKLKKLDDEGLLEAYVLMARPDEGIALDHAAYLTNHRDLLRRYVLEYVATNGGK